MRATARGNQVYAAAREIVSEIELQWKRRLGKQKMRQLGELLRELNEGL